MPNPVLIILHQELRTQADAQKRFFLREWDREPIDLAADKLFVIVGAHRSAEQHRPGMLRHGLGQRVAQAGPADIES